MENGIDESKEGGRQVDKLTVYDSSPFDPNYTIFIGSNGVHVFIGYFEKTKKVAVKRIDRDLVRLGIIQDFQKEAKLMLEFAGHPNILQYYCTEMNEQFIFIATELCKGTLQHLVEGKYKGPKVGSSIEVLIQITRALAYLHDKGVAHRDLKPANIFITDSYGNFAPPRMKLADFGLSSIQTMNQRDFPHYVANPWGTGGWMAPELSISSGDGHQQCDLYKVDIFALGLIFAYTLSGGKHPFCSGSDLSFDSDEAQLNINNKESITLVIGDLKKPSDEYIFVFELIRRMVAMDPLERPASVESILNDMLNFAARQENLHKDPRAINGLDISHHHNSSQQVSNV